MKPIDLLLRIAVDTVNQEWFTKAVREVIEKNNAILSSSESDMPNQRQLDETRN